METFYGQPGLSHILKVLLALFQPLTWFKREKKGDYTKIKEWSLIQIRKNR